MQDFKKLLVWQKSHVLTLDIYGATKSFPRDELYGLTRQMRRAASSVPTNIAEGCGRMTPTDTARFMTIALGSASELEYHLILARDLQFLAEEHYGELSARTVEVKKMLSGMICRLKTDN